MNVRLKQFVTIQRLKDKLIISGTYKEGTLSRPKPCAAW